MDNNHFHRNQKELLHSCLPQGGGELAGSMSKCPLWKRVRIDCASARRRQTRLGAKHCKAARYKLRQKFNIRAPRKHQTPDSECLDLNS